MDLRLLREWIRNPLLLEGVSGQDLEALLHEFPVFEAGHLLSLQRMKINHSSRFAKAMASYSAMTDQGQWLYRAMERQTLQSPLVDPLVANVTATRADEALSVQTRLDWFTLLGHVDWKAMETNELDLLYAEYRQTDYLEASSDWPSWEDSRGVALNPSIATGDVMEGHGPEDIGSKVQPEVRTEADRIREMAAKSLDLDEVPVSESLAELYLEQGQMVMAARIYRRLMLRFPAKSAYFRSRIDQLES